MIILVGGEKGGTGKSTIATSLAAMRAARGFDVLLFDADPQQSSQTWAATRQNKEVSPVTCVAGTGRIQNVIRDLANRYDDVIIDAGGRDSVELRAGLVVAHRLYTPLQPSYADAWTLHAMQDLVGQARALNEALEAYVVLSRAYPDPRIPETQEAIAAVEETDELAWSGVILCERVDFRRAFGFGLCPEEYAPHSKAATETRTLYDHAFDHAEED